MDKKLSIIISSILTILLLPLLFVSYGNLIKQKPKTKHKKVVLVLNGYSSYNRLEYLLNDDYIITQNLNDTTVVLLQYKNN